MSSWLIEKDPLFAFEYKTSHFCNAMRCGGLSNPLRYVLADYRKRFYYIFKTEELDLKKFSFLKILNYQLKNVR